MTRKIDISHKTIFFIAGFLAVLWILYHIIDVILLLFVAIIFMSALSPFVEKLTYWKVPRGLAIGLLYLLVVSVIIILLYLSFTPLIEQTSSLTTNLPHTLEKLLPPGIFNRNFLEQKLSDIFGNALGVTVAVFSNTIAIVSVAVLTFYLLLDKERFENLVSSAFVNNPSRAKKLIRRIEDMLGAWLRGQVVLSLLIGVMSYILLLAVGMSSYALPLAILAGIMEVVPVIGPIISAIPPILIAYVGLSPATGLVVAIGYLLIQQSESHIIVPQVMKRAVGLNPLVVILAIAIGGRLLGIGGALLAVPITVVAQIIVGEIINRKESII